MRITASVGVILGVAVILTVSELCFAGQKSRSGSYRGRKSSGTFQQDINRSKGKVEKNTTWKNEKGQGSRTVDENWDKQTGTGSRSATTTNPEGQTKNFTESVTFDTEEKNVP